MAAGQNVPKLGGYDFEFTSEVPNDFECPVCQLTIKDPIQIIGCGHRLCKICSESLLRSHSPKCPIDREPLSREKIFPDSACHRKILDLTVKCPHVGCPWTGELRAVQKHQEQCLFKMVECPNTGCKEKLTRRDMNNHKKRECIWRTDSCEYCQGSYIVKNRQHHHSVCRKFPVKCTNNCTLENIPRGKLVAHIRDDCLLTEIHCKYKNLGCQEVFQRVRTKSHLESHLESHLNLALCSLEIIQNQVKEQSKQIERLTSTFNDQIDSLMAKNVEQSQQLNDQSQQIDRLMAKNVQQSQQLNDQSQQIASLMFTVQGLVQQRGRLKGHYQYQAIQVKKTTDEAIGGPNQKGATNVRVQGGDTMKQDFKPKSTKAIEVGMKVLFNLFPYEYRGTVKYVGFVPELNGYRVGVEVDPDQPEVFCFSGNDGTMHGKRYFT
ncbi:TNF receptor-associated factor 6-like, partial [Stylophora pistillata]|uniref:TNF receptor-associated factor 6-like n=1 Tax=Stylophora pistillata TaxID=50429 RepID=UPI000C046C2F